MKIKNKFIICCIITVTLLILKITPSYAGSIGISSSTKSVEAGQSFKVTISGNNAVGSVKITGSNCKVSESSIWLEDNSQTITVTAGNSGTAKVTVSTSDMSDSSTAEEFSSSKSVSVSISSKEDENKDSESSSNSNSNKSTATKSTSKPTSTPVPTKSSDATLKNFGISPKKYDFSGFKKSKTSYKVNVDNEAEEVTIYAYPTDDNAIVSGEGKKSLKVGENTFNIKVTAEDKKTTKTYTLNINRKEASNEKTEEDSNTTKEDEKEQEDELNSEKEQEENKDNIDENETEIEETTETIAPSGIKNIIVNGYNLKPNFSPNVFEYSINVKDSIKALNIQVEEDKDVEVEIAGNNNLKEGANVITILAHKKDDTITSYQLYVTIDSEEIDITQFNYEMEQAQASLKIKNTIIYAVMGLIAFLTMLFIISKRIINRRYEMETEGNEIIDNTFEVENPYTIYNDSEEMPENEVKKKKSKNKGKRFK